MGMGKNGDAKHVYAVIPRGTANDIQNGTYTIPYRDIEALVCDCVPPGESIFEKAQDSGAPKCLAAACGKVVDSAWAEIGTVLGYDFIVRADDMGSAEAKVRRWLREGYGNFKAQLNELRNKVELRVCILWDTAAAARSIMMEDEEVRRLRARAAGKSESMARIYRRKAAAMAARKVEERAASNFAGFYRRLKPHIEGARVSSVSRDPASQMIVNLALLVRLDQVQALGEELGRLGGEPGVEVRLSGLLPPYTFSTQVVGGGSYKALLSRRGLRRREQDLKGPGWGI